MAYNILLLCIGATAILAAFITPFVRKAPVPRIQNIDYISQAAMFLSGVTLVMLLIRGMDNRTRLISVIVFLLIPVLSGVNYLLTLWRAKRSGDLKTIVTEDERTENIYGKSARNALVANNFTLLLLFIVRKTIDSDSLNI